MPRKSYLTRTITSMKCTAMMVNTETAEVFNKDFTAARIIEDANKLNKYAAKILNTDNEKFVAIVDTEIVSGIYGISEEDFMAHAVRLGDNRTEVKNNETAQEG